jgi:hypothetical protein
MFGRGAILLLAGAAIWWASSLAARADEAAAKQAIGKLLDVGWSPSAQGARLMLPSLRYRLPGPTRALAAAWLVLMQQRRSDDALKRALSIWPLAPTTCSPSAPRCGCTPY